MTEIARYLVTTAVEGTWKHDRPVLFLGEWCREYRRRHIWLKMDRVVAEPFSLAPASKDENYSTACQLEQTIFTSLRKILNTHHKSNHGDRFWKIVLGHWLKAFVHIIFNRYHTLDSCLDNYKLSGTAVANPEKYELATRNILEFLYAADDANWNHVVFQKILGDINGGRVKTDVVDLDLGHGFRKQQKTSRNGFFKEHLLKLRRIFFATLAGFYSKKNALIIGSYLPRWAECKLHLSLGQLPQVWDTSQFFLDVPPDRQLRLDLKREIFRDEVTGVERQIRKLLFEAIPICYLEGFKELQAVAQHKSWPDDPEFIFTCNNYEHDEIFKIWVAQKTESGTPYFVGQHGGNFGTQRIPAITIEEETADKYITWGDAKTLPQHTPAFLIKTLGRGGKRPPLNPKGKIILVAEALDINRKLWDGTGEYLRHWEDQLSFFDLLGPAHRANAVMRLDGRDASGWDGYARLSDLKFPISIDRGECTLEKLTPQMKLLVFTYNSTGFLENLSQNIPTIAFWIGGMRSIRDSAKPAFEDLIDVGIFHGSFESAASHINAHANNVDKWWNLQATQDARIRFCLKYAKFTHTPINDLKDAFRS